MKIWAHEAGFDRRMLDTTDWWPEIPLERWRCTAAMARMHGLMGGLDKLCKIFKIDQFDAKDASGVKTGSNSFANPPKKDPPTFMIVIPIPLEWDLFLLMAALT